MASSAPRRPQPPPTTLLTLPDELLEEILLRLPAAADLARASMARISFRCLVSGHRFLRRFRTRHPPPLLGIISARFSRNPLLLQLAQPPHPSSAAASTLAGSDAADFSCSFLPSAKRWRRRDLRDGRVLLSGVPEGGRFDCNVLVRDLAVCDPLNRRYILLPATPYDLAEIRYFDPFLAPPAIDDEEDMSFRVICLAQCITKLVLLIFSSGSGQWRAVTFDSWITLITGSDNPAPGDVSEAQWPRTHYYAHGCFCWVVYSEKMNKLLMLDTRSMSFSTINLPPGTSETQIVILEAGKGRIGLFISDYYSPELRYNVLRSDGVGANRWLSEAMLRLPVNYRYVLMGVAGGYLLLQGLPENRTAFPMPELDVFSLNLKTLQLEWFLGSKYGNIGADLFAGFLTLLSVFAYLYFALFRTSQYLIYYSGIRSVLSHYNCLSKL